MEDYIIKRCKYKPCNRLFKTDSDHIVHCSPKCTKASLKEKMRAFAVRRSKWKYKDIPDIPTCKICGFQALRLTAHLKHVHGMKDNHYRRKYKAKKSDIYHSSYIEGVTTLNESKAKVCKVCEEEFEQKTTRQECCSKECSAELHRITSKFAMREYSKRKKEGTTHQTKTGVCKECGTEFTYTTGRQVFCKVKCRNKWFNKKKLEGKVRRKRNCAECGKEFEVKRNEHSCSKKCRNKLSRKFKLIRRVEKSIEKHKDNPDIPTCKVCGFRTESLPQHLPIHKMTTEQYCKKYNVKKEDLVYAPLAEKRKEVGRKVAQRMYEDWLKTHKQSSPI